MNRIPRAAPCAALCLALSTGAALAHATLAVGEARPNASYRGVVQISHGCDGQPTNRVSVTIPEGIVGAKPMAKPGWQIATEKGPYARAYPYYHGTIAEGVKTITWTGNTLPDDQVDEFVFVARVTDAFAPGSTVYFPIEQDCAQGGYRWTAIPAPGQDAHALKTPAPGIRILAAAQAAALPAATVKAGDLTIETPWMRATPGGATVAGGYVRITNTGTKADRLTGASIPLAGSGSIHSMTMDGSVMKMAALPGGLVVEPGQTVELKPGGLHLMFEDLKGAPKVGESISGTLVFERAGVVPVTFSVAPIGALKPGGATPAASAEGHQH